MTVNRRKFLKASSLALAATQIPSFCELAFGSSFDTERLDVPDDIRRQIESDQYGGHSIEWHVENAKTWPIQLDKELIKKELRKDCSWPLANKDDEIINGFAVGLFPKFRMTEIRYKYLNADGYPNTKPLNDLYKKIVQFFLEHEIPNYFNDNHLPFHLNYFDHEFVIKRDFNILPVLSRKEMQIGWICYEDLGWRKIQTS